METKKAITTIKGLIRKIDTSDRFIYRRGEPRRKTASRATISVSFEPIVMERRDGDDDVHEPDDFEFDIPRELASELRVGMDVEIDIKPKW